MATLSLFKQPRYFFATGCFTIGFILSPLTWWNDLVVNVPIAWVVGSVFPQAWFKPVFILSYWGTNILGLVMMHVSGETLIRKKVEPLTWKSFQKILLFTGLYSILFWLLITLDIIQPLNIHDLMDKS